MSTKINTQDPVILLGAGLSGSLMALYLAKRGFKVEVYERRPDMRTIDISAGKSINLALSVRGLTALEGVGMKEEIMDLCIPMRGRMVHSVEGEVNFQAYSKDEKTAINSVSRGELNMRLMNKAEAYEGVNFHFNQRCNGIDTHTGEVILQDESTQRVYRVKGQTAIGSDGAYSGIRQDLQRTPRFNFSQEFLEHGYKELTIPPSHTQEWRIAKNCLHIWPRGAYMLIALPNLDGSFTVTLFFPYKGKHSFEQLDTPEKVTSFFNEVFPDAVPHMPSLVEDFFENPTGDLVTIRCNPWSYKDKVTLIGDASHAVVPFFGQGMNAAFEDCTELDACIEEFGPDWETVFTHFQNRRIPNANAIADMALENYIEMRDNVGDEQWVFRKKVEHHLENEFPGRYISRYEMVSFTNIPYAEAFRRGEVNNHILNHLVKNVDKIEDLDMEMAEGMISELLG